ncbi:DUF3467 domain-containing protein [Mesonia sediminis]|jgi:hypothetical protein|uniref:DUF3467 domain-containing protein n=1 Tax=Mesonia sediminis TaxID=1703946 RepID=A0ABW5SAQ0_9FLAO|nr:DUF3467 domain-containing protein [Mesonia sp. HuA40]TXK75202.1 DUF3467 domain-containing protein [Mesonia sp. HuA40]
MSEDQKNKKNQLNIELDNETAQGKYSNLAIINHSPAEFVVDFVSIMPGAPKSKVQSRIILTPQHAKRLHKALGENIQRFEQAHGTIENDDKPPIPLNFGPTGQA